jgi:hypothetical protein
MVGQQEYADPLQTQEAYEVAMHSKLASDWELFVTLRKQKNKDETTQASSVLTGCRRDCLTVEEGAWIQGSLAAAKQPRDTRSGSMPANSAVCESIRAADGTEVTESAELQRCSVSITSSWVPLVCAEFDADNSTA